MNLLIITQKLDKNDDGVLGFFHNWVEKFSKHFESITLIALQVGEYNLPKNVKVYSLGKESGVSRIKYIFNFYRYIWNYRKCYDAVFVHMNIEYIILAGVWWRLMKKKVFLWYNHTYGTHLARIAGIIAHKTFHTSSFAFTARFKNAVKMPAGIDIDIFKRNKNFNKVSNSILYLGRISPVKHVDVLLEAVKILDNKGVKLTLDICGPIPERDKKYYDKLRESSKDMESRNIVNFCGSIPTYKSPGVFNTHEIFVNLTPIGNFDKTVLESMACETLTLVSSKAFKDIIPEEFLFKERDPSDLANKIENVFNMSQDKKNTYSIGMRKKIIEQHSLSSLAEKIKVITHNQI